jgi:flagellar biogenesis protein FliO
MVSVDKFFFVLFLCGIALPCVSGQTPLPEQLIRSGGVVAPSNDTKPTEPEPHSGFLRPPSLRDPLVRTVSHESVAGIETATQIDAKKPLPLAARGSQKREGIERPKSNSPWESLATVGGSLAFVLGLFFCLAWLTRRGMPLTVAKLPGEVIEVLGKSPLSKGQEMQLVRIGAKLILLSVTPHGSETLTEIVDAEEVDRLSAVCRRNNPKGVSVAFNQMLANVGREPAQGFATSPRPANARGGDRYA